MLFRAVLTNRGWRRKEPDFCQKRRILGRRGCPSRNPTQPWPCNAPRYCKAVKQSSAAFEKLRISSDEKHLFTALSAFWSFCLTCFPHLWNIFSTHPSFSPLSPLTKCTKEKPKHWKIMIRTTAFTLNLQCHWNKCLLFYCYYGVHVTTRIRWINIHYSGKTGSCCFAILL